MSAPVEVPEDIVERVRALCLVLPEVTVRVDYSLTKMRSTALSFDISRRSFCLLVAVEGRTGKPVPLLVLRADPDEREALLSIGHPFFAPRAGRDRIGVLLSVERNDPVTNQPFRVTPVRIENDASHDTSDMLRADDAQREASYDSKKAIRAGSEVIVQSFGL